MPDRLIAIDSREAFDTDAHLHGCQCHNLAYGICNLCAHIEACELAIINAELQIAALEIF